MLMLYHTIFEFFSDYATDNFGFGILTKFSEFLPNKRLFGYANN